MTTTIIFLFILLLKSYEQRVVFPLQLTYTSDTQLPHSLSMEIGKIGLLLSQKDQRVSFNFLSFAASLTALPTNFLWKCLQKWAKAIKRQAKRQQKFTEKYFTEKEWVFIQSYIMIISSSFSLCRPSL